MGELPAAGEPTSEPGIWGNVHRPIGDRGASTLLYMAVRAAQSGNASQCLFSPEVDPKRCFSGWQGRPARLGKYPPAKIKEKDIRVLTCEEQIVFEKIALQEGRWEFILCLYTGLRLGELCALKWENVNWAEGSITVCHSLQRISHGGSSKVIVGSTKSASSNREIPLPSFLCSMLRDAYQDIRHESHYVVPGRDGGFCDMRTVQARLKKLTDALRLEGVHVHTLRHTYATRCLECGIGVETLSDLLGHSAANITLRYYAHSTRQHRFESVRSLELLSACAVQSGQDAPNPPERVGLYPLRNGVYIAKSGQRTFQEKGSQDS